MSDPPFRPDPTLDTLDESNYTRGSIGQAVKRLWVQEGGTLCCAACGWTPPVKLPHLIEVHHVIPVAAGGSNSRANLLLLCPNHHAIAHGMFPVLAGVYRGPVTAAALIAAISDPAAYYEAAQDHIKTLLR